MSRAIARCETASLALSRTDSSIHENQRDALRRADRDVGGAQAFAVGEGGVRNDADIDAELGKRAAGKVAAGRCRPGRRRPCWRRRCGPSRSRWTTRSPSASIRPRKRSSLSCSSHMRSASVSISARLRAAVCVDVGGQPALGAQGDRKQVSAQPRRCRTAAMAMKVRRAGQLGKPGSDQDRDDDEERADSRGLARSAVPAPAAAAVTCTRAGACA